MGTVDEQSRKSELLSLAPDQLAKLAKSSRAMKDKPLPPKAEIYLARALQRRLSPEHVERLANRYTQGASIATLSREAGVSRPALRTLLREAGVPLRSRGMTPEDADRAIQLYESGLTFKEVVGKVGYSNSVINRMLHRRGVKVRPRNNQG